MNAVRRRNKVVTLSGRSAELAEISEHSPEMIRKRAYELFLARGATHGADLADWFRAEQELRAQYQH
jgi:hypothetical protein